MSDMDKKLDVLLQSKSDVQIPAGLESRIMAKVTAEKLKTSNTFFFFVRKNYYAFASVLSVLIVVGLMNNTPVRNQSIISKAVEQEIMQSAAEADYYKNAADTLTEINKEMDMERELEKLDDYQIYLDAFGSNT